MHCACEWALPPAIRQSSMYGHDPVMVGQIPRPEINVDYSTGKWKQISFIAISSAPLRKFKKRRGRNCKTIRSCIKTLCFLTLTPARWAYAQPFNGVFDRHTVGVTFAFLSVLKRRYHCHCCLLNLSSSLSRLSRMLSSKRVYHFVIRQRKIVNECRRTTTCKWPYAARTIDFCTVSMVAMV